MKVLIATLLATLCLVPLLHAGKDGPDEFQVQSDYKALLKNFPGCNQCWSTSRVTVVGKRPVPADTETGQQQAPNYPPDRVAVEVNVHGSMIFSKGASCREGPCANITKEGTGISMRLIFYYNRFGDKWMVDSFKRGGVLYQ